MADKTSEAACPVDHKTRDAWLAQARASASSSQPPESSKSSQSQQPTSCSVDHTSLRTNSSSSQSSWTQTITSYIPWVGSSSSSTPAAAAAASQQSAASGLDTNRVISTIPRSAGPEGCPVDHGSSANAEIETGAHASGNWVYPSEKMFFDAMRRKGHDAREVDMKTVVPIHNAVNERAWKEIKEWEAPYLSSSQCDGPKLESFANKMDRMTPTARLNTILGYMAPFDRHDWVIDRCGTRVDYVIDFYAGRPGSGMTGVAGSGGAGAVGGPSFYLDVRPKLNTWEGVKMRAMRWTGLA